MLKTKIMSTEIRSQAPKRLKHYTVPQGACADEKHIYIAFEQKAKGGRPHRIKIAKLEAETMEIVKVSGALKLGHANDLCIRDGIIYATHSAGSKVIHRVNAKTLKQKKGINVKVPKKYAKKGIKAFNGISTYGKSGFLVRVMGGRGMAVLNKNMKVVKFFRTNTNHETSQGMYTDGRTILRAYSKGQSGNNHVAEYSMQGKELDYVKIDIKGEMECIWMHGGEIYVTTYIKKGGKRKAYIAWIR